MKSLFLALMFLFASITPAASIEDVTERDEAEEMVCHMVCDETYEKDGYKERGMPVWFFRKFCVPMCLERMRCNLSLDETQWICRERLPASEM